MAKLKKTKVPPVVVSGDSYAITIDGVEYRPHVGEQIRFRRGMSPDDYEQFISFQALAELGKSGAENSQEQLTQVLSSLNSIVERLASSIIDWTWTDAGSDTPLPPPSAAVLSAIDIEEITWMVSARVGSRTEEQTKNA